MGNAEEEKRVGEVAGQWLKDNIETVRELEAEYSFVKDFYSGVDISSNG